MIKVRVPGSCGELVQGTIDGCNFLVTCPINIYSQAIIPTDRQPGAGACGCKVQDAINKTIEHLQLDIDGGSLPIGLETEIPKGKGMASSSADIGAISQAVALYCGKLLTPGEIADIALSIEPTDAVFFPGVTLFDHIDGKVRRCLGVPPKISIAVFDAGGEIDTLSFNKREDLAMLNHAKAPQVRQALDFVIHGLKTGDAKLVGRGATLSALANQTILYKQHLETFINVSSRHGAVGVNVAHSGTVLGILFEANHKMNCEKCVQAITALCPDVHYVGIVDLIPGGSFKWEGDMIGWRPCL